MQQVCWLRRLFYRWFPPPEITVHHAVKSWPLSLDEVRVGLNEKNERDYKMHTLEQPRH